MSENILAGLAGALGGAAQVAVPFFKTKLEQELIAERERKKPRRRFTIDPETGELTELPEGTVGVTPIRQPRVAAEPKTPEQILAESKARKRGELEAEAEFPQVRAPKLTQTEELEFFKKKTKAVEDIKFDIAEKKEELKRKTTLLKSKPKIQKSSKKVISDITKARKLAQNILNNPAIWRITGVVGKLPSIPGSAAADLEADLESFKAMLGFSSLQEMRAASPTGGAVGNVSDYEQKLFQKQEGSFEQTQSAEKLRANVSLFISNSIDVEEDLNEAFESEFKEKLFPDKSGQPPITPPSEKQLRTLELLRQQGVVR